MTSRLIILGIAMTLFIGCSKAENYVLEVTTFRIKTTANTSIFSKLDSEVETKFTSKQPGYIKRQSAVNEQGEYLVLVYWNTSEDAEASMNKFMHDESVMQYASMIDGATMKMARYKTEQKFDAEHSAFVEVMSFNINEETKFKSFKKLNEKVDKEVTSVQKGFVKRIIGNSEEGTQIVAVYWDNKLNSDKALKPFMEHELSQKFMSSMDQESIQLGRYQILSSVNWQMSKKDKVVALLNSFNTGDQTPVSYINPQKYIQHNLSVADGLQGFGAVMQQAPPEGFKADVIRAFEDGEYVLTHTLYDFFGPKTGFDVFRFERGKIVEHWDNLAEIQASNPSGHTQSDGHTSLTDLEKTVTNKQLVRAFVKEVLLDGKTDKITTYINPEKYIQHNPSVADGLDGFEKAMKYFAAQGITMEYTKLHKILGEGNFVLAMSEGKFGKGEPTAFYDLFRIENNQIIEHWDVIAPIPAKEDWKNENGKF